VSVHISADEMSEPDNQTTGTLFVVSTPIGNLKDITLRALEVLKDVDLIAAEDTRHTRILLQRYDIRTQTTSYFDFNKEKKTPVLIAALAHGKNVAVVSDAGTPGISDPAYRLVSECLKHDIRVETLPGATALIPALILSGLATDRFVFEGFLPLKKGRKKRIEGLAEERRTIVLYESPHRLMRTLRDLEPHFAERRMAIVREITKKFEQVLRGVLKDLMPALSERKLKGEIVLVIEGKRK